MKRGKTEKYFEGIIRRQLPTKVKERRADVVLNTGLGKALTNRQFKRLITSLI